MLLRKILIRLLGFENYLKFISAVFIRTFLLKIYLKAHYQVRFLAELVKAGDYCLDIGANLGYFSVPLSHLAGETGKVWAVEPVPLFRKVLAGNVQWFGKGNVEIVPFALGDTDGATVQMATPTVAGVVRHGRTQIVTEEDASAAIRHEVQMRKPSTLFADLPRLDFVKCDVEGYELHIVPHLLPLFEKFRPILEIEAGPEAHKAQLMEWLLPLDYAVLYWREGKLHPFTLQIPGVEELYFLPTEKA